MGPANTTSFDKKPPPDPFYWLVLRAPQIFQHHNSSNSSIRTLYPSDPSCSATM
jgi:hypothetical protein